MYKVGIVGAESTHAEQFSKLINQEKIIDAHVKYIWHEPSHAERGNMLKDKYAIDCICENYEDMIGDIDVVFIVTRNGDDHFEQAKPFMDAGIPVWIDKPIALDSKDVERICEYAQSKNAVLMGGSTFKDSNAFFEMKQKIESYEGPLDYFSFSYCSSIDHPNGGISFYSIHPAEVACVLFGDDIKTISAHVHEKNISVMLDYENGTLVNLMMTNEGYKPTYTMVYKYLADAAPFDAGNLYADAIKRVESILNGEEKPLDKKAFIAPAKMIEKIEEAFKTPGTLISYK